jgi:uncharacterized protein (TIGR00369 family)
LDKINKVNKREVLEKANAVTKNTLMETLGIEFVDFGEDFVTATMPVNSTVHQPMGLLHGGATAALAESLGSTGSYIMLGDENAGVVGIEVNANHLRSVKDGLIRAEGRLLHKGRRTHVWDIRVTDEEGRLISVCRLTNMVLQK